MKNLLPCPFCGGRAMQPQPYGNYQVDESGNRIDKGRFIQCEKCGANIFRSPVAQDDLVPAWNRRV